MAEKPSWDVNISPVDNGIIVHVGCKTLVFSHRDQQEFLDLLKRYLNGEQKKIAKEFGWLEGLDVPQPCAPEERTQRVGQIYDDRCVSEERMR
jgi:hypothetical protein